MAKEDETNRRVEGLIDAVLLRFDNTPAGSTDDIYVWSNGTVTSPPSGEEGDDPKLLTVITPGGERPTPEALRETLTAAVHAVRT